MTPENKVVPLRNIEREIAAELAATLAAPLRTDEGGAFTGNLTNVVSALMTPKVCGLRIGHDTFRSIDMFHRGDGEWQPLTEQVVTDLRMTLYLAGFRREPAREMMRDALQRAAAGNQFDSAQLWLGGLVWDGRPRVETFCHRYFGAEDTPYSHAVGLYLWTAMAGRTLEPGVQADMAPILVGGQGARKTSGIKALVPHDDFYCEIDLGASDDDNSRKLRGALVAEIGELRGLSTRSLEEIKAFISRRTEIWIPKYQEFAVRFPRRSIFIGSTNASEFLCDGTGNRRWLPLQVGSVDVEAIARDRNQLWAEAAKLFKESGVLWHDAEALAREHHDDFAVRHPWEDSIKTWVESQRPQIITAEKIMDACLLLEARYRTRKAEMDVGYCMGRLCGELGYRRERRIIDGERVRGWFLI